MPPRSGEDDSRSAYARFADVLDRMVTEPFTGASTAQEPFLGMSTLLEGYDPLTALTTPDGRVWPAEGSSYAVARVQQDLRADLIARDARAIGMILPAGSAEFSYTPPKLPERPKEVYAQEPEWVRPTAWQRLLADEED